MVLARDPLTSCCLSDPDIGVLFSEVPRTCVRGHANTHFKKTRRGTLALFASLGSHDVEQVLSFRHSLDYLNRIKFGCSFCAPQQTLA